MEVCEVLRPVNRPFIYVQGDETMVIVNKSGGRFPVYGPGPIDLRCYHVVGRRFSLIIRWINGPFRVGRVHEWEL